MFPLGYPGKWLKDLSNYGAGPSRPQQTPVARFGRLPGTPFVMGHPLIQSLLPTSYSYSGVLAFEFLLLSSCSEDLPLSWIELELEQFHRKAGQSRTQVRDASRCSSWACHAGNEAQKGKMYRRPLFFRETQYAYAGVILHGRQ